VGVWRWPEAGVAGWSSFALIGIWILLSVLAARIAEGKGRSGGLHLLVSLFLTAVVGILMAVVARPDRADGRAVREILR
jgi:hypothetical protein